jgi:chromate transporter
VWFTIYTLFDSVTPRRRYGVVLHQPTLSSIDWASLTITVGALIAVFRFNVATMRLVGAAAVIGIVHGLLTT